MYYLGIDLGGTNIAVGIVDENNNIIARGKSKTHVPCTPDEMCEQLASTAFQALENAGLTVDDIPWIGIGTPGSIERESGVVVFAGNLHLKNFEMKRMLEARMKKTVLVENDANAAAYGEFKAGALRGAKNALAITLGTGVGSGIIIDGKIYAATNSAAGEMGHMVIQYEGGRPCTCGRSGCWETYASATGLIHTTKEIMLQHEQEKNAPIWTAVEGNIDRVGGRTAFDAMRAGDPIGQKIVDIFIAHLGCGIANCINTLQPDILCIGGGVCNEGETLLAPLRSYVENECFQVAGTPTQIKKAELGNDAGIIGAALLGA